MTITSDTMRHAEFVGRLLITLQQIDDIDRRTVADYSRRELLVWAALHLARAIGLPAGVRIDPNEPEWPVVFIELPTGQVSWHQPQHINAWDRHTNADKHARIQTLLENHRADDDA